MLKKAVRINNRRGEEHLRALLTSMLFQQLFQLICFHVMWPIQTRKFVPNTENICSLGSHFCTNIVLMINLMSLACPSCW